MAIIEGERNVQKHAKELLKERADDMEKRLRDTEKTVINNAQYLRRRQLEVSNVPTAVPDEQLTRVITDFLRTTGEDVKEADIDKCHRLSRQTTVIMEFGSRKVRDGILMSRKKLKDKKEELQAIGLDNSFINESLCYEYRQMDYVCRRLKKSELIKDTWYFNGKLFVVDYAGKKHQIRHITDTYVFSSVEAIATYLK